MKTLLIIVVLLVCMTFVLATDIGNNSEMFADFQYRLATLEMDNTELRKAVQSQAALEKDLRKTVQSQAALEKDIRKTVQSQTALETDLRKTVQSQAAELSSMRVDHARRHTKRSVFPTARTCPNGFAVHDGSCYALSRLQATWAEAMVYCEAVKLMEPPWPLLIVHLRKHWWYRRFGENKQHSRVHTTSGSAEDMAVEGEFLWAKELRRIHYADWHPGSPGGGAGVHCLALWEHGGHYKWDDGTCELKEYFVCEVKLDADATVAVG